METVHKITIEFNLTRRKALLFLAAFFLCWRPGSLGSETLTMTTYYPAPYGGYARLLTTNQTLLARDAGNVGIGTNSPTSKLHIVGTTDIRSGDLWIDSGQTIRGRGRLHITGTERLYVLNNSGLYVSRAWGGNGNINVEGDIQLASGSRITGLCTVAVGRPSTLYRAVAYYPNATTPTVRYALRNSNSNIMSSSNWVGFNAAGPTGGSILWCKY